MPKAWTDLPPEIRDRILHHVIHKLLWSEALESRSRHERSNIVEPQLNALTQVSYTFSFDCVRPLQQILKVLDAKPRVGPWYFWEGGDFSCCASIAIFKDRFRTPLDKIEGREVSYQDLLLAAIVL